MKIALVMNNFYQGGAERMVKDLAYYLKQDTSIEPVVIVANRDGKLESKFREQNITVVSLNVMVATHTVPIGAMKLVSILRNFNIDLVHSHLAYPDLISRIASAILSLDHVSTYHNVREKRPLLKNIVEGITWRLSDRIICVSDGVRQSYNNRDRMRVIYNGIDVEAFRKRVSQADTSSVVSDPVEEDTIFVNIARCVEVKRQHDLIRAVSMLNLEDVHLYIIGDGPKRSKLENLVSDQDLNDQITLTGYVKEIEPYYAIADVFVSSSSMEGLPTTHIEAMAAQLPIVSTDIPGVREMVKHGKHGYLCPVGDSSALATAMKRLRLNERELEEFGEHGYETARSRFSIDSMIEEHIELYTELLGENG